MTIKSATPSGSQSTRAPGGWARCWADNVEAHLQGLPKPWPSTAMTLDLDLWVDRVNHGGQTMPGRRCLASRWGVGERTARTVIDRWRECSPVAVYAPEGPATRPAEGPAEGPATRPASAATMPMDSGSDVQNRPAEGPATRPAEGPAAVPGLFENLQPVGIVEAPQTSDIQTSDKSKNTRVKRAGWTDDQVKQVLNEMHAIELRHNASARPPSFATQAERIRAAAYSLKDLCKETGRPARELIISAWEWWWSNPNPFCRDTYRGAEGYKTCLRPKNCKGYAENGLTLQAAKYIPTADEALDAVIEVGCSGAEARYPAAARAIRQTFDFEMSGDLNRMRNHPDPAKVRARWSAGYAKYLTPKPALALVAR
jgi:hypothetical protein